MRLKPHSQECLDNNNNNNNNTINGTLNKRLTTNARQTSQSIKETKTTLPSEQLLNAKLTLTNLLIRVSSSREIAKYSNSLDMQFQRFYRFTSFLQESCMLSCIIKTQTVLAVGMSYLSSRKHLCMNCQSSKIEESLLVSDKAMVF